MIFSFQPFLLLLAKKKKPLDSIKNIEHFICDKARGTKQGQISRWNESAESN